MLLQYVLVVWSSGQILPHPHTLDWTSSCYHGLLHFLWCPHAVSACCWCCAVLTISFLFNVCTLRTDLYLLFFGFNILINVFWGGNRQEHYLYWLTHSLNDLLMCIMFLGELIMRQQFDVRNILIKRLHLYAANVYSFMSQHRVYCAESLLTVSDILLTCMADDEVCLLDVFSDRVFESKRLQSDVRTAVSIWKKRPSSNLKNQTLITTSL